MTSLKKTILVWTAFTLLAIGAIDAAVSYWRASKEADDFLDGQLRQIALNIGDLPAEAVNAPHTQIEPEDDLLIEVRKKNGDIVRSPGDSIELPISDVSGFSVITAGGIDWRAYTLHGRKRAVVVAQQLIVRRELAERAAIGVAAPIAVTIPMAWIIVSWAMARVFDRLSEIGRSIQARGPDRLDPIPVSDVPSEVLPLIDGMNELLARLTKALDQQQQFVSDAAHHLRTPLSALYIQLENLRMILDPSGSGRDFDEMNQGLRRASKLVDQLLRLARFDDPQKDLRFESIDISEVLISCIADQIPIAAAKGIDLGVKALLPGRVRGSRDDLAVLFNTILDNAIRYTPTGGSVDVSVRRADERIEIEICDSGPGVEEQYLPKLTERFFRSPDAAGEGTGLGLAIVAAIAKQHSFDLTISNRPESGGLCVAIQCPAD
ncbi:ATP-binding protein [Methylocystis rosea]|uniref:histidine kinase n=1 Tax=Methylocystis rosea TaxID=173366 RepID=A0A3G8MA92_9HYPH|nr:ATP-binding protein [Methylocystis rosea]AZG78811.1 hypothetical protein EHO51_18400 [Methylocystis rosea]